jgi:hypothetical protein
MFLARDTRENKEAITQLRREINELATAVEKLSFEVQQIHGREKLEREKLVFATGERAAPHRTASPTGQVFKIN